MISCVLRFNMKTYRTLEKTGSTLFCQLTTSPQAVGVCKRNYPIIFPLTPASGAGQALTLSLRERELAETPPQADGVLKKLQ